MKRTAKSMIYGLAASVFAFAAGAVIAEDAVEYVTCVNIGYTTGPCLPSGWSDGLAPSPEKQYLVLNTRNADNKEHVLSTGNNSDTAFTFGGGLITVGNQSTNGKIIFCGCGTTTFPNGLKIYKAHGSNVNFGSSKNQNTYTHHIGGPIALDSAYHSAPQWISSFRSNGQHLYIDGSVSGDENTGIRFYSDEWSNVNTNNIIAFTGDLSDFKGFIQLSGSTVSSNFTVIVAFGNVDFPGTVKLTDGPRAFLRTAEPENVATIGNLEMPDGAALYPVFDIVGGKCGTINVTNSFVRDGRNQVHVKFLAPFTSVDRSDASYPLLKIPAAAGSLDADDFDLVLHGAGEVPEGGVSLRVADDGRTLALFVAAYSSEGVKDVELITSDAHKESAFLEEYADHWSPYGVPESGRTYFIKGGLKINTPYYPAAGGSNTAPYGDPVTFGGDRIVLGDSTSAGTIGHQTMAKVTIPELIITNGVYDSGATWAGLRAGVLHSDITIAATEPEKALFRTSATWQHLYLEGTLKGDANAAMRFLFTNANSDMNLDSDCSEYFGLIEVSATSDGGNNLADFRIGAAEISGTLKLGTVTGATGGKVKLAVPAEFEVAKLIVNRPTTLAKTINAADFTSGTSPVTVTDELELNSPIVVNITVSGGDPVRLTGNLDEAFIPVVKWPVGCEVDESKLEIGGMTVSGNSSPYTPSEGYFSMLCRTEGEWRVAGIYKRSFRYMLYPDDSKTNATPAIYTARTSFDECYRQESDRAYGWNWNDGMRPHPDCDYYAGSTLRTHSGMADVYFQGRALFLCGGTLVMQSSTATVTNLYISGGLYNHIHTGGDRNLYDFAPAGTRTALGNAYIGSRGATFTAPFATQGACFKVAMKLSGSGDVKFLMNSNNTYPLGQRFTSYLMLSQDNSRWTGKALCAAANAAQWDEDECLTVLFSDMNNLGGELPGFTYNGITLRQASILKPMNSVVYSRGNRGIFIEGSGGMYPTNGITFAVNAPVTYYGKLRKLGGGTLTFGGSAKFIQSDGTTVGDFPVSGTESNLLHVAEGSVGVTVADACDGVKAVFEDGASLCVKVGGDDDNLSAKGWTSVKTDTPFVLNASDGKLPVTFDASGLAADGSRYETAICTVSAAAAPALRGKFKLARPGLNGYMAEMIDEVVDADAQTVTFRARLKYTAMRVILR